MIESGRRYRVEGRFHLALPDRGRPVGAILSWNGSKRTRWVVCPCARSRMAGFDSRNCCANNGAPRFGAGGEAQQGRRTGYGFSELGKGKGARNRCHGERASPRLCLALLPIADAILLWGRCEGNLDRGSRTACLRPEGASSPDVAPFRVVSSGPPSLARGSLSQSAS